MNIYHLRNATMVIKTDTDVILVDPMLSEKGQAGPPFTLFRHPAKRNPIVGMPPDAMDIVSQSTICLITHLHPDHLDQAGERFLKQKHLPVACSVRDAKILKRKGINVVRTIDYHKPVSFLQGTIEGIPAKHGYGFVSKLMGNVMGYFIKMPGQKSVYLSSDTIYTDDVHKVLTQYKPDISVMACGSAQLDVLQPLLMNMDDIIRFAKNAPGTVIANHMEAVNHCPTTRSMLRKRLEIEGLTDKVRIPEDGQWMEV